MQPCVAVRNLLCRLSKKAVTVLPNPVQRRLRFVKLYYEFPPSCLYSDTRGGVST